MHGKQGIGEDGGANRGKEEAEAEERGEDERREREEEGS